jgi:hypothetical protein
MIKLASQSNQLPSRLFLHGVDLGEARDPWKAGGFADIFKGFYNGDQVVGKRLRFHGDQADKQKRQEVSIGLAG